jgi:hypothetical protein
LSWTPHFPGQRQTWVRSRDWQVHAMALFLGDHCCFAASQSRYRTEAVPEASILAGALTAEPDNVPRIANVNIFACHVFMKASLSG